MSRGPAPSDPYSSRGGGKAGPDRNRGPAPQDPTSSRGGGPSGPQRGGTVDPAQAANGLPPLPPDTNTDPFNTNTGLILTQKPGGLKSENVTSGGLNFNLPAIDFGKYESPSQMVSDLYGMKQPDLKALQKQLVDAGYLPAKDSGGTSLVTGFADQATVNAYQLLLTDVQRYQKNPNNRDMTVQDLLEQRAEAYKAGANGSTTKTTKSINLFSPLQAQSFLEGAAEKYLGRRPTQAELSGFFGSLNAYQEANPDTTTQTVSTDQSGNKQQETDANKTGITALHGGDQAGENYILQNDATEAKGYAGDNALMAIMSHLGLP